jgi:hypothetical protein
MLLSTANIMGNPLMTPKRVSHDATVAKSHSTIIGWQEIGAPRYKRIINETDLVNWETCQLDTAIPISVWSAKYKILSSGHQLTHHGKALASPNRYFSWALVTPRSHNAQFMVVNSHFVSGAWNSKLKPHKAWRQRMWEVHWSALQTFVLDVHKAGIPILGTGDYNRVDVKKFHPEQHWLTHGGIDKLWWLQAPHGPKFLEVAKVQTTGMFSDHALRTARIRLR